jgi:hypothetical protein
MVIVNQLVQGRVARRTIGRIADLQYMLGRIFRVHPEFVYGPSFHCTNTRTRGKRMLGSFFQEMHGGFDAMATANVDTRPVIQAMNRLVMLAVQVFFGFVDEYEGFIVERNTYGREGVAKRAYGRSLDEFRFEDAWASVNLDEDDRLGHLLLLSGVIPLSKKKRNQEGKKGSA